MGRDGGASQRHCSTISMMNIQFTKVQQLQKRVGQELQPPPPHLPSPALPRPHWVSILFTAVSDDVLTNLQQHPAPSGRTSGPRHCQSTPRRERWELMLQIFYSGLGKLIQVNCVQCLPARRVAPNLLGVKKKGLFLARGK